MEPDLGGQEKNKPWSSKISCDVSQWSLTLEVRKSRPQRILRREQVSVAMEPDLGGQEKLGSCCWGREHLARRNGA